MMPVFFFIAGYFALSSIQRKGLGSYVADRLRRLGIPWLLVMLTLVPISVYTVLREKPVGQPVHGFWDYFISRYLSSFGTVRVGMVPPGQITQMHLWYVSLLIAFFIVFGLAYEVTQRVHGTTTTGVETGLTAKPATTASIMRAILLFGVLSIAFTFAAMLIFPDASWVTIDLLLQFQPTKVCVCALVFGLGVYAYSRQWFEDTTFFSRPGVWALVSVLLVTGYVLCGREVFAHPYDSQMLSPALLFAFATIRSFLTPAILIMLVSFAHKYMNRPMAFNQELSANSFNIYLVHFFFVVFLQDLLMIWRGGPPLAKMGIVLLITLPASYGISRLISRFPRGFVVGLTGLFVLAALAMR